MIDIDTSLRYFSLC